MSTRFNHLHNSGRDGFSLIRERCLAQERLHEIKGCGGKQHYTQIQEHHESCNEKHAAVRNSSQNCKNASLFKCEESEQTKMHFKNVYRNQSCEAKRAQGFFRFSQPASFRHNKFHFQHLNRRRILNICVSRSLTAVDFGNKTTFSRLARHNNRQIDRVCRCILLLDSDFDCLTRRLCCVGDERGKVGFGCGVDVWQASAHSTSSC